MDLNDAVGMVAPSGPDAVTPDLSEVQQQEPDVPALDVDVVGPVQMHALPARTAVMHNVTVGTTATQIVGRDQRRGRLLLWAYPAVDDTPSTVVDNETITTTGTSSAITAPDADTFSLAVQIDNTVGTTPTMDIDVEWSDDGGTTWFAAEGDTDDLTQVTTTDTNVVVTLTRRAPHYRLAYTVGGTDSPSYDVTATTYAPGSGDVATYFVGTRDDEVQSGTAAKVVAAAPGAVVLPQVLELRHCEPVYVKASSGTVDVQYIAEQWAD
jgi:hypothetical protein